jgi:transposase-like protein
MAGLPGLDELFEGRHFDCAIVIVCVRWYLRFKLSFPDLAEMMAEHDLSMAYITIMRWVHHYAPEIRAPLEPVRAACRVFVARRRDLHDNPR